MVSVSLAGRERDIHAHGKRVLAILVDQDKLALQHEDELILLFMPVTQGRIGARLQGEVVHSELRHAEHASQSLLVMTDEPLRMVRRDKCPRRRFSNPADARLWHGPPPVQPQVTRLSQY